MRHRLLLILFCVAIMPPLALGAPPNAESPEGPPEVEVATPHLVRAPAGPAEAVRQPRTQAKVDPTEEVLAKGARVSLSTMIDELMDEFIHQLAKQDAKPFSPLAIRLVRLSSNLRPELAATIQSKLLARMGSLPNVEQVVCLECRGVRSRVEGEEWVVNMGATRQADLKRIGEEIGARAFLDVDLTYDAVAGEVALTAVIYRASDGRVLWSTATRGDETTAAILRTGVAPPSREEQLGELKRKLEQRPYFGYTLFAGFMYIDGSGGGYPSANLGVRLYERFGSQRRHMYGIQLDGIIDWNGNHSLFGGAASLGYWYAVLRPMLNRSELRIGATAGAFIAGGEGNSVIFQAMAEYLMQFRLAFNVALLYMVPEAYNGGQVGGVGGAVRCAFSW